MHISKDEILMGRDKKYPKDYTEQISDNIDQLLIPINKIRDAYGHPMTIASGWRPPAINLSTPGAAPHSKHMIGLAVDIQDKDGSLMKWVLQNLQLMKDLNIYCEDFRYCPNWVHFGLGPPISGKRIFIPNSTRAPAPSRWTGIYDHQYDD